MKNSGEVLLTHPNQSNIVIRDVSVVALVSNNFFGGDYSGVVLRKVGSACLDRKETNQRAKIGTERKNAH